MSGKAATASSRGGRTGARSLPSDIDLAGLQKMMRTGRTGLAGAKVRVALQDLPPAKLQELAAEMREQSRKNPSYDWNQIQLLDAILGAWASADPQSALSFVRDTPSRGFRANAYGSVFAVLGEADPEGAITLAKGLGEGRESMNALGSISWALAQRDPKRALQLFDGMKELPEMYRVSMIGELAKVDPEQAAAAMSKVSMLQRRNYWNSDGIFSTWATDDPDAVLAWADKSTDLDLRNSAIRAACRRWASDDPQAALQKVDSLPQHLRGELVSAIMSSWADRDLKGALAAAGALPQPAQREEAMAAIVNQMDWTDPEAGSQAILAMPKGNTRTQALEQLAYGLNYQSATQREAILEKFSGVEHAKVASMIAASMVTDDPAAAIKLFSSVPATQRDDYTLNRFVAALASQSPEVALDFAGTLDSSADRSQTIKTAIAQMASLSPTQAAARLDGFKDPNDRQQALSALAENWGATDPAAALAWASTLSGDERTAAVALLLPKQAANDPKGAATQLSSLLENPGNAPSAVLQSATMKLATEWAGRDPEATGAWVSQLPAGSAAEAGASALVVNWSSHDPAAAAAWLSNLPAGGVRDAAIEPLVTSLRQSDPDSAFSWGLSIADSTKRAGVMETTIKGWNQSDAGAVKAALQNARLEPDERAAYEKLLR